MTRFISQITGCVRTQFLFGALRPYEQDKLKTEPFTSPLLAGRVKCFPASLEPPGFGELLRLLKLFPHVENERTKVLKTHICRERKFAPLKLKVISIASLLPGHDIQPGDLHEVALY